MQSEAAKPTKSAKGEPKTLIDIVCASLEPQKLVFTADKSALPTKPSAHVTVTEFPFTTNVAADEGEIVQSTVIPSKAETEYVSETEQEVAVPIISAGVAAIGAIVTSNDVENSLNPQELLAATTIEAVPVNVGDHVTVPEVEVPEIEPASVGVNTQT